MRITSMAFVATLTCLAVQEENPGRARDQLSKQELQRIQGSWQFVSFEENGEKMSETDLQERTVFFGGESFLVQYMDVYIQAGNQKLDPSKTPKTINTMIAQGERKGDILLGIYELADDTLKVCFNSGGENRPTEFKGDAGSGNILVVYKRIRGQEEPKQNITGEYTSLTPGPGGIDQTADVEIEKLGDAYMLTWRRNNAPVSAGIGMRKDNFLSVSWSTQSQSGIAVYQIDADKKLTGRYASFGGIGLFADETLTPKRRVD